MDLSLRVSLMEPKNYFQQSMNNLNGSMQMTLQKILEDRLKAVKILYLVRVIMIERIHRPGQVQHV
jgi:hypothetical protein